MSARSVLIMATTPVLPLAFGRVAVALRRRSRISVKRNASQLARTPGAVRGQGFIRMRIKLAGLGVALDRGVKLPRIEFLEPRAKPRQLARGKLFDGFLDVFCGGHAGDIAVGCEV